MHPDFQPPQPQPQPDNTGFIKYTPEIHAALPAHNTPCPGGDHEWVKDPTDETADYYAMTCKKTECRIGRLVKKPNAPKAQA